LYETLGVHRLHGIGGKHLRLPRLDVVKNDF
jgi:hypothetical protein